METVTQDNNKHLLSVLAQVVEHEYLNKSDNYQDSALDSKLKTMMDYDYDDYERNIKKFKHIKAEKIRRLSKHFSSKRKVYLQWSKSKGSISTRSNSPALQKYSTPPQPQRQDKHKLNQMKPPKNTQTFPTRLHKLLERATQENYTNIISWQPHGQSFTINNVELFLSYQLITNYLMIPNNRFIDFQNQLALYGFKKCTKLGSEYGAYYHESFRRGRGDLCATIMELSIR